MSAEIINIFEYITSSPAFKGAVALYAMFASIAIVFVIFVFTLVFRNFRR